MLKPLAEDTGQVQGAKRTTARNSRVRNASGPSSSLTLWAGIAFSALFTLLIWALDHRLAGIELLPDSGATWYYWKLPAPTFWTRATSWGFYLAHQLAIWGIIYYAQTYRKHRYTKGLHKANIWALAANAFFIFLHLLQTHVWYDGLAQDTPIFSSQGAVIVLLVWVLLMENNPPGPVLRQTGSLLQRGRSLCPHLSRILFRLGHHLHFLVSPHGINIRSPDRILLHVPASTARQSLLHAHSRQSMVDFHTGIDRTDPRNARCCNARKRPLAYVSLRICGHSGRNPDAWLGPVSAGPSAHSGCICRLGPLLYTAIWAGTDSTKSFAFLSSNMALCLSLQACSG